MKTIVEYFKRKGREYVKGIQDSMTRMGKNVTGRTSRSIRHEVTDKTGEGPRLKVIAESQLVALEEGRGPTKKGQGGVLQPVIEQWVRNRSIASGPEVQGIAYVITNQIHEKGTLQYQITQRTGKGSGVITDTINDPEIDAVASTVSNIYIRGTIENILNSFE